MKYSMAIVAVFLTLGFNHVSCMAQTSIDESFIREHYTGAFPGNLVGLFQAMEEKCPGTLFEFMSNSDMELFAQGNDSVSLNSSDSAWADSLSAIWQKALNTDEAEYQMIRDMICLSIIRNGRDQCQAHLFAATALLGKYSKPPEE